MIGEKSPISDRLAIKLINKKNKILTALADADCGCFRVRFLFRAICSSVCLVVLFYLLLFTVPNRFILLQDCYVFFQSQVVFGHVNSVLYTHIPKMPGFKN